MLREALLVKTLVQLADTLADDFDVVDMLTLLADRCVEILEVNAAGLMLTTPDGGLRVVASSSEAMRMLELFELQAQEGPCLDCFHSGQAVINEDLTTPNPRWPRFTAAALQDNFQSVHALPLHLRGTVIGALNLFRTGQGTMTEADLNAGQALADIATIAILQHRASFEAQTVTEQLNSALNSRIVIEQAKGIVAERVHLDMEQSFAALRSHARRNNLRLESVARAVIEGSLGAAELQRGSQPKERQVAPASRAKQPRGPEQRRP